MRNLTSVLMAAWSVASVASAGLVNNGAFEVGGVGSGSGWISFGAGDSSSSFATNYNQPGTGATPFRSARLRLTVSRTLTAFTYQAVPVTPGRQYQIVGDLYRTDGPNNWYGAFFIDGGFDQTVNDAGNRALITSYIPGATTAFPLPAPPSDTLISAAGLAANAVVCEAMPDNVGTATWPGVNGTSQVAANWRSIAAIATDAGSPTNPNIGGPTGAEWQTKTATGNYMLVGFFIGGNNAGGTQGENDIYADNFDLIDVTIPEPATLMLLGLGAAAMLRRRQAPGSA